MIRKTNAIKTTSRRIVKKPVAKPKIQKPSVRKNTLKGYSTANEKRKEFKFTGVNFDDGGKYTVVVSICLGNKPEGKIFSAMANVNKGRVTMMGGQCLDEIYENSELRNNPLFKEIYSLWKKYHLNDMHAGTPEQEKALKEYKKLGGLLNDYPSTCEYLKEQDLYEVMYRGKPYVYGTAWLFEKIPDKDLKRIESLFQ